MTKPKEVKPPIIEELTPEPPKPAQTPPKPVLKPITSFTQEEIMQLDSVKQLEAAMSAIAKDGLELQINHNYFLAIKK